MLEAIAVGLALDQVRHDLAVGFGGEVVALTCKLALELEIVLDDAVVNQHGSARAVPVRMRVAGGRFAVRGPPRMADAIRTIERIVVDGVNQMRQLSRAPADFDRLLLRQRNAGRVVPAILEASQPVEENRDYRFGSEVSNDAAHIRMSPFMAVQKAGPALPT